MFDNDSDSDGSPLSHQPRKQKTRIRKVNIEWEDDQVYTLIAAVEQRPLLWDARHEGYRKQANRDAAWREISTDIFDDAISPDQLLIKWGNLRVQYNMCESKRKKGARRGKAFVVGWKYFNALNFIGTADPSRSTATNSSLVSTYVEFIVDSIRKRLFVLQRNSRVQ